MRICNTDGLEEEFQLISLRNHATKTHQQQGLRGIQEYIKRIN